MRRKIELVAALATIAVLSGGWILAEEIAYQARWNAWDQGDQVISFNGPNYPTQPQRDFPWEAMFGAIAISGGAVGWLFKMFGTVDARIDEINQKLGEIQSQIALDRQAGDSGMTLIDKEIHILYQRLEKLQSDSDLHDRRLYQAVEELTEALRVRGLFNPRGRTGAGQDWPTADPPTGAFPTPDTQPINYNRPPTPPPGQP